MNYSNDEIQNMDSNTKKEYLKALLNKYRLLNEQIESLSTKKGSK